MNKFIGFAAGSVVVNFTILASQNQTGSSSSGGPSVPSARDLANRLLDTVANNNGTIGSFTFEDIEVKPNQIYAA
jgi:hypothetical protein